jgi:hypothetical protein
LVKPRRGTICAPAFLLVGACERLTCVACDLVLASGIVIGLILVFAVAIASNANTASAGGSGTAVGKFASRKALAFVARSLVRTGRHTMRALILVGVGTALRAGAFLPYGVAADLLSLTALRLGCTRGSTVACFILIGVWTTTVASIATGDARPDRIL